VGTEPNCAASIENLKNRCETYAALGRKNVYAITLTTQKIRPEDYKPAAIAPALEVQPRLYR